MYKPFLSALSFTIVLGGDDFVDYKLRLTKKVDFKWQTCRIGNDNDCEFPEWQVCAQQMLVDYQKKTYFSGYGCFPSFLCDATGAWEAFGQRVYAQMFCTEEQIAKAANFDEAFQKGYELGYNGLDY